MRVAVLGCGWSGVMVALRIKNLLPAAEVVCIDRDFKGGLLRSEMIDGYLFDVGGSHVVFSRDPSVIKGIVSMGGRWASKDRGAFVFLDGIFVPYPFENGIYILPPEKRARYGISLIRAYMQGAKSPRSFKEWILNSFGDEVAHDYLLPYNEKIWKRPLEEMSADWVYIPGRLPIPSLEDIVKAIAGLETKGYVENSVFHYPDGGIVTQYLSALSKAREIGISLVMEEVSNVRKTSDGFVINSRLRADHVVSTLPLRELPYMLDPLPPEEVLKSANRLDYNSVAVVGVGVRKRALPQHWVYVPDKRIIFHRYAWISNYLPDPPPDRASLITEVTIPPGSKLDPEKIIADTLRGLEELGVVKEGEVDVVKIWFHKYGYPLYTKTHEQDRRMVEEYLKELKIITFGRWGNWHYWNTDVIYKKASEKQML